MTENHEDVVKLCCLFGTKMHGNWSNIQIVDYFFFLTFTFLFLQNLLKQKENVEIIITPLEVISFYSHD